MSDKSKKLKAKHKKPAKKEYNGPVEVIVYDCITKQKVIAEYRFETKQFYSEKLHKVYHPLFTQPLTEEQILAGEMGWRWVSSKFKILDSAE